MKEILERFEHLLFRILKHEQGVYSRVSLVHPHSKVIHFQQPASFLIDTGRAQWNIHSFSNWNDVPVGLFNPYPRTRPVEDPVYNVILTPQKLVQFPSVVPPSRILTPELKDTGIWVFTGCLRDKYYY